MRVTGECACGGKCKKVFVFACSGGSDVGELADRAARRLDRDGVAQMYCLAGIGGDVSGIVKTTEAADAVLVIDGCSVNCGKKTLQRAGFQRLKNICITDLGFRKGETEVNAAAAAVVAEAARGSLRPSSEVEAS
jgi:uncharacterized metal-binding protein